MWLLRYELTAHPDKPFIFNGDHAEALLKGKGRNSFIFDMLYFNFEKDYFVQLNIQF